MVGLNYDQFSIRSFLNFYLLCLEIGQRSNEKGHQNVNIYIYRERDVDFNKGLFFCKSVKNAHYDVIVVGFYWFFVKVFISSFFLKMGWNSIKKILYLFDLILIGAIYIIYYWRWLIFILYLLYILLIIICNENIEWY